MEVSLSHVPGAQPGLPAAWASAAEAGRWASAALSVAHGWKGFMLPAMPWMRRLPYFPPAMASRLMLRDSVWDSGSAMLLCPPQYQTSPNVTCSSVAVVVLVQPVHGAVTVKSPPAGAGARQPLKSLKAPLPAVISAATSYASKAASSAELILTVAALPSIVP